MPRQFQGSLGPFQDLEPDRRPEAPETSFEDGSCEKHAEGWSLLIPYIAGASLALAIMYAVGRVLLAVL